MTTTATTRGTPPWAAAAPRAGTRAAALATLAAAMLAGCEHGGGGGVDPDLPPGDQPAFPLVEGHVAQADVAAGRLDFATLFEAGDLLFEAPFNGLDGAGAGRLPDGSPLPGRFSRVPPGGGRFTGPNGQACFGCHDSPFPTSAGEIAANVLQDPARDGLGPFNARNTTSLFAAAVPQRLAEEMTEELRAARAAAIGALGASVGSSVRAELSAKGIRFGALTVRRIASEPLAPDGVLVDARELAGVDPDLVVRPYGWKGNVPTLRAFTRGAAADELGMEAEEVVVKANRDLGREPGDPAFEPDLDGDGVGADAPELTVGDVTALVVYTGAQEIPVPRARLTRAGILPPLPAATERLAVEGRLLFAAIGCADCHVPELRLADPVFEEPTLRGDGAYLDAELAVDEPAYDPLRPFRFHLVRDGDRPRLEPHPAGGARVELFSDLRRHRMGPQLGDPQLVPVEPVGADGRALEVVIEDPAQPGVPRLERLAIPLDAFLTPELWGVGNSGPWLHDGRAATLEEAIRLHGFDTQDPLGPFFGEPPGEAQAARDAFVALAEAERLAVVTFLSTLVHFAFPETGE